MSNQVNNDNKDSQMEPVKDNKALLPELSSKQKDFIEKLLQTGKTYESYLQAGYTGSYKSSYELRRRLLPWITELSGCTATEVYKSLRELQEMPVTDREVTFKDKLELAKFKAKLAKMTKEDGESSNKQYSTLIVQRFDTSKQVVTDIPNTDKIIDTQ